mgnify:CR=1 FL=1
MQSQNRLPFIDSAQLTRNVTVLDSSGAVVCSTGTCLCTYGQIVKVRMTHPFRLGIPFLLSIYGTLPVEESQVCWRGGAPS